MNCKIFAGVVLGLGQFDSDVISLKIQEARLFHPHGKASFSWYSNYILTLQRLA